MTPTIGRIVHYRLPAGNKREGEVRPAVVVMVVNPTTVNLHVFHDPANDAPLGSDDACSVDFSEEPRPATWCWPSRAP